MRTSAGIGVDAGAYMKKQNFEEIFYMDCMITEKTVKNRIGRRNKEIHKGDCGRILIAAGSWGMAGAAILAARSALRAGAGLVRLAIPEALFPIVPVSYTHLTLPTK